MKTTADSRLPCQRTTTTTTTNNQPCMNFVFLSRRGDYFHGKELEFRDMEICCSSSYHTAACLPVTTIRGMLLSSRGGGAASSLFPRFGKNVVGNNCRIFSTQKNDPFSPSIFPPLKVCTKSINLLLKKRKQTATNPPPIRLIESVSTIDDVDIRTSHSAVPFQPRE